jgi:hypothetical protein
MVGGLAAAALSELANCRPSISGQAAMATATVPERFGRPGILPDV